MLADRSTPLEPSLPSFSGRCEAPGRRWAHRSRPPHSGRRPAGDSRLPSERRRHPEARRPCCEYGPASVRGSSFEGSAVYAVRLSQSHLIDQPTGGSASAQLRGEPVRSLSWDRLAGLRNTGRHVSAWTQSRSRWAARYQPEVRHRRRPAGPSFEHHPAFPHRDSRQRLGEQRVCEDVEDSGQPVGSAALNAASPPGGIGAHRRSIGSSSPAVWWTTVRRA